MVKYDHDISINHTLTTLLYIFITDIATPDRNTTAIRKNYSRNVFVTMDNNCIDTYYIMVTTAFEIVMKPNRLIG